MESPARNRALRLLVGLMLGAALIFLIAADTAEAVSCSGTIGPKETMRRGVPTTTVKLEFTCDTLLGNNSQHFVYRVKFGGAAVDQYDDSTPWDQSSGAYYGSLMCEGSDSNEFDCVNDRGYTMPAGWPMSGTPSGGGEEGGPVCAPATVSVFGDSVYEPLYTFQPTNNCPVTPPRQPILTVKITGDGAGTVDVGDTSCRQSCVHSYPVGQRIPLAATPDTTSRFDGWSGACTGAGVCQVMLSSDTTVEAKFTKLRGTQPTGNLHASVDSTLKVSGTSVTFTLGCHAPAGRSCGVLAALTTTQHMRSGKVIAVSSRKRSTTTKKVVTLAKKSLTIAAGAQKTVTLSLNKTGKTLLARFHKLPARLTASLTNTTKPIVIVSKTVTFKPQKTKRGR